MKKIKTIIILVFVTGTISSLTTNSCTNCSATPINVQNPYSGIYV